MGYKTPKKPGGFLYSQNLEVFHLSSYFWWVNYIGMVIYVIIFSFIILILFLSYRGPAVGFGKKKRSVIEQDFKAKDDILTNLDSQKKNRLMFLQAWNTQNYYWDDFFQKLCNKWCTPQRDP